MCHYRSFKSNLLWDESRIIILAVLLMISGFARGDCYSRDGVSARNSQYYFGPELVTCGNGTNNCCLKDQKCGTNLLCVAPDGAVAREYCAVKSWDGCSELCPDHEGAGTELTDCGNNIFCCSFNETCCTDNTAFYVHPDTGKVQNVASGLPTDPATYWSVDSSALLGNTSTRSSNAFSRPTTTSSASITTNLSDTRAPSTPKPNASESRTTCSTSNCALSHTYTATSSNGLSAGAGTGIGVGCAAMLAGIVALSWLLIRERRRRIRLQANIGHVEPPRDNRSHTTYELEYAAVEMSSHEYAEPGVVRLDTTKRSRYELGTKHQRRHEMS